MEVAANSLTLQLGHHSTQEQIQAALETLAKSNPDPITLDKSLRTLGQNVDVSIKAVRQHYNIIAKNLNIVPPDLGLFIAKAMLAAHYSLGLKLKLSPDGAFYAHTGTHWEKILEAKIRSQMQECAAGYSSMSDKTLTSLVSDAMGALKDFLGADQEVLAFTQDPQPVINCQNGELWFDDDGNVELRPHKPASNLSYCLPYIYDPKAICPIFNEALLQIFSQADNPEELCNLSYEMMGYAIQPRRPHPCFWMLIGHGANGKTTFLETLCRLISPDYLYNVDMSLFGRDKFNTSQLPGKLVMIDDDIKMDTLLPDGLLKKISESKKLSARRPYGKESFTFINTALPIMAGNHYPLCHDLSQGMIRRAMIIPFNRQFSPSEQDKGKFEYIWRNEMPGILNKAIEGYKRVIQRDGFELPQECLRARKDFLAHGNPLYCFLTECLVKDEKERVPLPELRGAYDAWGKMQNIPKLPIPNRTLKRRLEGMHYEIGINNGYSCIKGYRLRTSNDNPIA